MKRILIIRPDNIGDFVIFSGVLKYYKSFFLEYKIDLLCSDTVKELAVACPYFDNVFSFSPKILSRRYLLNRYLLKQKFRKFNYDKIIYPVYSRSIVHERLINLVNGKEKIVFDGNFSNDTIGKRFENNKKYTKIITSSEKDIPEIKRNLEFLHDLGFNKKINDLNSKVWFTKKDEEKISEIFKENGLKGNKFVICSPGAASKTRIWDTAKWIEVIKYLLSTTTYKIVLCGHKKETLLARKIKSGLPKYRKRITDLSGMTNLTELAALIKKTKLFIGSESGPIHIAAAVKTPNICIIGGGHFARFYPYGNLNINRIVYKKLDCFGCNWRCKFNKIKCFEQIKPIDVISEIKSL